MMAVAVPSALQWRKPPANLFRHGRTRRLRPADDPNFRAREAQGVLRREGAPCRSG